jgi:hypothetical protein
MDIHEAAAVAAAFDDASSIAPWAQRGAVLPGADSAGRASCDSRRSNSIDTPKWSSSRLGSSGSGYQQQQQQSPSLARTSAPLQSQQQQQWWSSTAGPRSSTLPSPFESCANSPTLQRTHPPNLHAHRHVIDAGQARRSPSLQMQALLHNASSQQLQPDLQHEDRALPSNLQQQQHIYQRDSSISSTSSGDLMMWPSALSTHQQQQQQQQQPPAAAADAGWRLSPSHTSVCKDSLFGQTSSLSSMSSVALRQCSKTSSDLGTVGSEGWRDRSSSRVRALVMYGGSFRRVGLGGTWEYVGGGEALRGWTGRPADTAASEEPQMCPCLFSVLCDRSTGSVTWGRSCPVLRVWPLAGCSVL